MTHNCTLAASTFVYFRHAPLVTNGSCCGHRTSACLRDPASCGELLGLNDENRGEYRRLRDKLVEMMSDRFVERANCRALREQNEARPVAMN